jgi:hypothetical protein
LFRVVDRCGFLKWQFRKYVGRTLETFQLGDPELGRGLFSIIDRFPASIIALAKSTNDRMTVMQSVAHRGHRR